MSAPPYVCVCCVCVCMYVYMSMCVYICVCMHMGNIGFCFASKFVLLLSSHIPKDNSMQMFSYLGDSYHLVTN